MSTVAATSAFLVILILSVVGSVVVIMRAEMRPPMMLLAAGITALILAIAHFSLGAFIVGKQLRGLWAEGIIAAVPATLGAVGATALSVWVAIWAADQARLTAFNSTESESIYRLRHIVLELQRQSAVLREQWAGVDALFVQCGELMCANMYDYEDLFSAQNSNWFRYIVFNNSFWPEDVNAVLKLTGRLEDQIQDFQLRTGLPSDEILSDFKSTRTVLDKFDDTFSIGSREAADSYEADVLGFLAVIAAGAERVRSGAPPNLQTIIRQYRDHFDGPIPLREQGPGQPVTGQEWKAQAREAVTTGHNVTKRYAEKAGQAYDDFLREREDSCAEAELLWRQLFEGAHTRLRLLNSLSQNDLEAHSPKAFTQVSHSLLWNKIIKDAEVSLSS